MRCWDCGRRGEIKSPGAAQRAGRSSLTGWLSMKWRQHSDMLDWLCVLSTPTAHWCANLPRAALNPIP